MAVTKGQMCKRRRKTTVSNPRNNVFNLEDNNNQKPLGRIMQKWQIKNRQTPVSKEIQKLINHRRQLEHENFHMDVAKTEIGERGRD